MNVHATLRRLLIPLLIAAGTHAQESRPRDIPRSLDTLFSSDIVLARVGPAVVTVREFLLTSLVGPAFVKRQPDTRRRMLDYMINEKLLALGAEGRSKDPRVVANLTALEGDMASEELYRDDVLGAVRVTEEDIGRAVAEMRTSITLRWLYRKGRDSAEAVSRELRSGRSFDALYREELADSGVKGDERTMTSSLFQLRRRNAGMAALAETLRPGIPSGPMEAPDGFYIVCVDSLERQVIATETEEAQERYDARRALTMDKADSLSDLYVRKRMLGADPVIQRPVFDLLRAYLASRVLPAERVDAYGVTRNLQPGLTDYRNIDRFARRTLVTLRKGAVTLGQFLLWYRLRETNLNFRTNSPQAFFMSVEDVVWRMVRDQLLVRAALGRGLQHRPGVVMQKRWWREKLLYQLAKDSIMRTIGWSDSTLHAYYTAHPRSFRDSTGALRPYGDVKDDVLREWHDLELKGRMLRRLNALKRVFPVTRDDDLLRRIPLDVENDPRAIEVYTVKKGGTFPHPAFPTIDTDWQTWQ